MCSLDPNFTPSLSTVENENRLLSETIASISLCIKQASLKKVLRLIHYTYLLYCITSFVWIDRSKGREGVCSLLHAATTTRRSTATKTHKQRGEMALGFTYERVLCRICRPSNSAWPSIVSKMSYETQLGSQGERRRRGTIHIFVLQRRVTSTKLIAALPIDTIRMS